MIIVETQHISQHHRNDADRFASFLDVSGEHSRGVHPAVDDGVVHGVAHGDPEDDEIHVLHEKFEVELRPDGWGEEEDVCWKPAHGEDNDHHDQHAHDLNTTYLSHACIST